MSGSFLERVMSPLYSLISGMTMAPTVSGIILTAGSVGIDHLICEAPQVDLTALKHPSYLRRDVCAAFIVCFFLGACVTLQRALSSSGAVVNHHVARSLASAHSNI